MGNPSVDVKFGLIQHLVVLALFELVLYIQINNFSAIGLCFLIFLG